MAEKNSLDAAIAAAKSADLDAIDTIAVGVLALAGMTKVTIAENAIAALHGPVVVVVHPKVAARLRELTTERKVDG